MKGDGKKWKRIEVIRYGEMQQVDDPRVKAQR